MPENAKLLPGDKTARVMVIDDSPSVLRSLVMLLHHFGFQVWGFLNDREAVSAARECDPDVLICDAHMEEVLESPTSVPERIKGVEVASEIQKVLPRCEVIVMSSNLNPATVVDRAEKLGMHVRAIPKPANPAHLISELRARTAG